MTLLKSIPSHPCNVSSRTRIGAGRISRSNDRHVFRDHEFNFGAINSPLVVSTGSKSGPSAEFFAFGGVEGEGILSLNFDDVLPAQFDSLDGVLNDYSLISNQETGTMNDKEDEGANDCCGGKCDCNVIEISGPKGLQNRAHQERITDIRDNNRGSRPEEFGIAHRATVLEIEDFHG